MKFSRGKLIALVLLVIIVGLGARSLLKSGSSSGRGEKDRTGKVERGDLIQRVTIAGTVIPFRKTVIMAPYSGYVKKLYVKVGDKIQKGDPIVSISQTLQSVDDVFPIRAPFSGSVVQVEKAEGEYAKEYDLKDFIARVDDVSHLYVMADAPEIDATRIRIGQEAVIKASAILERSYKGVVRELALAAKAQDQWARTQQITFTTRIEVLDQDEQLRPGMSTILDIVAEKTPNVLLLGHEFINREDKTYFVMLKNGEKRVIELGKQNEQHFEIKSGLNEGDEVKQIDFLTLIEKK